MRLFGIYRGTREAVNLGNDAGTIGAVFGRRAGAYYGEEGIPAVWRVRLANRELIEKYAEKIVLTGSKHHGLRRHKR